VTPRSLLAGVRALDLRAQAAIGRWEPGRGTDAALRALSLAADRSALWFAIAGVLARTSPRGRAAARLGVVSLLTASGLANGVLKRLVGGARPVPSGPSTVRALRTMPRSAAFPSGHSAAAAAFAVGVALERPRAGLPVLPLAALVAYSRLHVGAHWLSDVVGGAALGAGVPFVVRGMIRAVARRRMADLARPSGGGPPWCNGSTTAFGAVRSRFESWRRSGLQQSAPDRSEGAA
jgi:membrane-associated phospholipid phosphatase